MPVSIVSSHQSTDLPTSPGLAKHTDDLFIKVFEVFNGSTLILDLVNQASVHQHHTLIGSSGVVYDRIVIADPLMGRKVDLDTVEGTENASA